MIFYFSSTGNSQWVARHIGSLLDEQSFSLVSIAKAGFNACDYDFTDGERLIFVFPVHTWSVPSVVRTFISKFTFSGKPSSVYAVCTCGDDCGCTYKVLTSLLAHKGLQLNACYSVQMPNDYVLFRGFTVDSPQLQELKLKAASAQVDNLAQHIAKGDGHFPLSYTPGSFPHIKTYIINPLFRWFLCGSVKFKVAKSCTGCGLCSRACPVNNIRMVNNLPVWRKHCLQCTSCFHHCPKNAIQWPGLTEGKKQYLNPNTDFDD